LSSDRVATSHPVLCLVVNRRVARRPLVEAVAAAAGAGLDWLQLREAELAGGDWLRWADELAQAGRSANPQLRVIINRRVDVALAIEADGVHLGRGALPCAAVRALLGPAALIGLSTHDPAEAAGAGAEVDYLHLAPIFDPRSKPAEGPSLGLPALREAARCGRPVFAQGGLDAARARSAVTSGAAGIAVTGEILMSDDPGRATAELRAALGA
jgi:thiamine-phosphate pyrophosphorylase